MKDRGQKNAGPANQAGGRRGGVCYKNVGTDPRSKTGPGKIGIGECILDLAGGNLTGLYERMASEKWCIAKPDYKSRQVWRERWESSLLKEKAREGSSLRWFGIKKRFSNFKLRAW